MYYLIIQYIYIYSDSLKICSECYDVDINFASSTVTILQWPANSFLLGLKLSQEIPMGNFSKDQ